MCRSGGSWGQSRGLDRSGREWMQGRLKELAQQAAEGVPQGRERVQQGVEELGHRARQVGEWVMGVGAVARQCSARQGGE